MITLQEYLNQTNIKERENIERISNCDDGLEKEKTLLISLYPQNEIDLSTFPNLKYLAIVNGNLTSIDFLNTIPHPEKLEYLWVFNNKIQSTNIKVFNKFTNLKVLKIGTTKLQGLSHGKHNKFYGSLKSYQNLTKLEEICIEATDVNEGLEYLPFNFKKGYTNIECSPHETNAKCIAIQNELRKYDYDLSAWQLSHPHKMYNVKPEIFLNSDTKSKWISALRNKLNKTQTKLTEFKKNEPNKIKKVKRLETKIQLLQTIQNNISSHYLIDKLQEKELVKKENKATQTEYYLEIKK